jgi:hypothetical protein
VLMNERPERQLKDRAWRDYSEHFRRDVLPRIMSSGATVSILSGDGAGFDTKQALELGAMLLLDKPLILVCTPGTSVPSRLARAADVVIEDWSPDNLDAQERIADAVRRLVEEP